MQTFEVEEERLRDGIARQKPRLGGGGGGGEGRKDCKKTTA